MRAHLAVLYQQSRERSPTFILLRHQFERREQTQFGDTQLHPTEFDTRPRREQAQLGEAQRDMRLLEVSAR